MTLCGRVGYIFVLIFLFMSFYHYGKSGLVLVLKLPGLFEGDLTHLLLPRSAGRNSSPRVVLETDASQQF